MIMEVISTLISIILVVALGIYATIQMRKMTDDPVSIETNKLELLKMVIDSLVSEENQLRVDMWKNDSEDGKLTQDQAEAAFNSVYNKVKSIISEYDLLEGVLDIFTDGNGLDTLIEESVNKLKTTILKSSSIDSLKSSDVDNSVKNN